MTRSALLASLVLLALLASPAAAQSATAVFDAPPRAAVDPAPAPSTATPSSTPTASSSSSSSSSSRSSGGSFPLLSQDQANGLFAGFLLHGFVLATGGIRQGLQRLAADANLVTNTAPDWTYQQPTVVDLQRAVQTLANASLGLVIFWTGLSVLLHPHLGGASIEIREVIPRIVLGAGLANSAGHWTALAIDLNDAACARLLGASSGSLLDLFGRTPIFDQTWLIALLLVGFLLMWIWLYLKMAARMAILMTLLVLAPAAQVCWVLPQTRGLAGRWHGTFWTTLYAQVVVTVSLKLAWGFGGATGLNPIALLITLCLLFLAANSPELLAGGMARVGLGSLVETALLAARMAAAGPAEGATAAGAGAARRAAGAGGATVPAAAVPRVMANPVAVSAKSHGTGGGTAVGNKASGFGRGGRAANP